MERFRCLAGVTTLQLDTDVCVGCGVCETVCPHTVYHIIEKKTVVEDPDGCMECGACTQIRIVVLKGRVDYLRPDELEVLSPHGLHKEQPIQFATPIHSVSA